MGFGNLDLGAVRLKKSAPVSKGSEPKEVSSAPASPSPTSDSPTGSPSIGTRPAVLGRTTSLQFNKASPVSSPGRGSPNPNAAIDSLLQWCRSIAEKYDGVAGMCSRILVVLSLNSDFLFYSDKLHYVVEGRQGVRSSRSLSLAFIFCLGGHRGHESEGSV